MKIRFLGVGSAFTTAHDYHSNMLIRDGDGAGLLLDCGSDARFSLAESGVDALNLRQSIDTIYLSHLHSDHVGGMEWLARNTYAASLADQKRIKLYACGTILERLWDHALQGGLGSIEGKMMHLTDYFECHALPADGSFEWRGLRCFLVEMPHVLNGYANHNSYGLILHPRHRLHASAFISTDTRFSPEILSCITPQVEVLFHECETAAQKSGCHSHYTDLRTLPSAMKQKMWLYHYQPNPPYDPIADGFAGFVHKGQEFDLCGGAT